MIRGMTGFGSTQLSRGRVKATIEIKSLNHRYLDLNFYLPIGFGGIEQKVRQVIQRNFERGRVTFSLKITEKPEQSVVLNKDALRTHLRHAGIIRKEFKLKNNLTLADVVKLPGVLGTNEVAIQPDTLWPEIKKGLDKALKSLKAMRLSEGGSLAADISDKLRRMSAQLKRVKARSKIILREKQKHMTSDEFKTFQKGCDVNEETARLQHYIDEIKELIKSKIAVGKKIDFMAQEMQRETNTIGAKLQDGVVSNAVIALKSKIEKIREQAQNIE